MKDLTLKIIVTVIILGMLSMAVAAYIHYDDERADRIRIHSTI